MALHGLLSADAVGLMWEAGYSVGGSRTWTLAVAVASALFLPGVMAAGSPGWAKHIHRGWGWHVGGLMGKKAWLGYDTPQQRGACCRVFSVLPPATGSASGMSWQQDRSLGSSQWHRPAWHSSLGRTRTPHAQHAPPPPTMAWS
ncbi:COMM domain-containing protein 7 [Platysternon megacephalum]|uniref:COMM domain-containing protein 7 n=1 Tax=Platysternon megacephalum TaxID=55544 RepID=A0A4D9E5B3_9SAUR|nr:COMM domain-containing protein 7 [Platysternon megacephalum]